MAPDPWGVAAVEDAPASGVKDPWGVAAVEDSAPAPLSGPIGAAPVPSGLQGPPARGLASSPTEVLGTIGRHALNAVAGPISTIGTPPQDTAEKIANAAMPGGLAAYRTLVKPSIAPAKRAIQQVGQGDLSGAARSAESAIPMVGPWADQVESDVANKGAVAGLAGLATDVLAPKAVAGAVSAVPAAAETTARGLIKQAVGLRGKDFARGADPAGAYLENKIGPSSSMDSVAEKAGDARAEAGQALSNAYSQADASGKLIPADTVRKTIHPIIDAAKGKAGAPGVMADPSAYQALKDSFEPALQAADAKGGFTPSELWQIRKNMNESLNWGDQSRLNLTKTQQRVSGALGGILEDAVPEAADLNRNYQGLTKLTTRAVQQATARPSLGHYAARATLGTLGGVAGHLAGGGPLGMAGGVLGAAMDTVPVKTTLASGVYGAGRVLRPAASALSNTTLPQTLAAVSANQQDRNDNQAAGNGSDDEVQESPSSESIPENETNTFPQASVAALPGPVRRVLSSTGLNLQPAKPHIGAQGNPAIASVDPGSPNTINVEDPQRFNQSGPQTLGHEAVHLSQNNWTPEMQAQIPADDPKDPYGYGGAEGLKSLRDQGLKLWNLPREKAATVVQYYISQGGQKAPQAVRDAYEPWVKDLNDAPLSTIKPTDPEAQSLETTPRPPQGQMYSTQTFKKGESDAKPLSPVKNGDKSTMQKGSPVTLPDGSRGKIMHILENMKTARVRTDDGKKVHVRLAALKVIPHVMVQSHARRITTK